MKGVIVTGGSQGIGAAVIDKLAAAGIPALNLDIAQGNKGIHVQVDVTDETAVTQAIEAFAAKHGLAGLVCSAGIHMSGNIEKTTNADFERMFDINVKGAIYATKAALPYLKQDGGSIVYLGSDQSSIAKGNSFAYNLSKHALASMAKTTALDYAECNIRANAVCPGTIETPLYHKAIDAYCQRSGANKAEVHAEEAASQPLNRLGQPNEVAALIMFLLSDEASFITGSLYNIDGGYCAQ